MNKFFEGSTEITHLSDIDLPFLLYCIQKNFKWIVLILVGVLSSFIIYSFVKRPQYQSTSTILIVESSDSPSIMAAQVMPSIGLLNKSSKTIGTLEVLIDSTTLRRRILNQHKEEIIHDLFPDLYSLKEKKWLVPENKRPLEQDIVEYLKDFIELDDRDSTQGSLHINVSLHDPKISQKVLSTCLKELRKYLNENSLTVSTKYRDFLEKQLGESNQELLRASQILNQFHDEFKVSPNESTIDIAVFEKLFGGKIPQDIPVANKISEQTLLAYLTTNLKFLEEVNLHLKKEFAVAEMESVKEQLGFHVIDPPSYGLIPWKPKRIKLVIIGFIIGCFMAFGFAFTKEIISSLFMVPKNNQA